MIIIINFYFINDIKNNKFYTLLELIPNRL